MKRTLTVLAVALVMAAMTLVMIAPAFGAPPAHGCEAKWEPPTVGNKAPKCFHKD
jgi:hypothetical protein